MNYVANSKKYINFAPNFEHIHLAYQEDEEMYSIFSDYFVLFSL